MLAKYIAILLQQSGLYTTDTKSIKEWEEETIYVYDCVMTFMGWWWLLAVLSPFIGVNWMLKHSEGVCFTWVRPQAPADSRNTWTITENSQNNDWQAAKLSIMGKCRPQISMQTQRR